MTAIVEELDKTVFDDILELKKHVRDLRYDRADDKRCTQKMQIEMRTMAQKMKDMENSHVENARLQDARMNNVAAQLVAICGSLEPGSRQTGNNEVAPAASADLEAHQRLDVIIKQLAEQVERAASLQVHETKVACHCTHTTINDNIKKLNKRLGQVCRVAPTISAQF